MNNPVRNFVIAVVLIGFLFFVQAVRIGFMAIEFRKTLKASPLHKITATSSTKKLSPPAIMNDLTLPEEVKNMNGEKMPVLFGLFKQPTISAEENAKQLEGLTDKDKANLKKQMLKRVIASVKELRPDAKLSEIPKILDFKAPVFDYRKIRETARYWYFIGVLFADEGDYNAALSCFAGMQILAHQLETGEHQSCLTLLNKMIAISLRKIACVGLLEAAPKINLPYKRIRQWINIFSKLEKSMPDMERCCRYESIFVPSIYDPKNMPDASIITSGMRDKSLQEEYIGSFYEPVIKASKLPFPQAIKICRERGKSVQDMIKRLYSISSLKYFFFPYSFQMQLMLTVSYPNMRAAFEQYFTTRLQMRGAIISLALQAYKIKFKSEPNSLEDVEKQLKLKLPVDVYTGKSFEYKSTGDRRLFSFGEDMQPDTRDDMVFWPVE